jgi:hypothetical protein
VGRSFDAMWEMRSRRITQTLGAGARLGGVEKYSRSVSFDVARQARHVG